MVASVIPLLGGATATATAFASVNVSVHGRPCGQGLASRVPPGLVGGLEEVEVEVAEVVILGLMRREGVFGLPRTCAPLMKVSRRQLWRRRSGKWYWKTEMKVAQVRG